MSRSDYSAQRRRPGMAAIGVLGTLLLVVVAGVALYGPGAHSYDYEEGNGALRDYPTAPAVAWSIDETALPGYTGSAPVALVDHAGDDWLLAYPYGFGRAFVLLDGRTGAQQWKTPLVVGLGDCAVTPAHRIGCAIKLGEHPDGFYLVDDDGTPRPAGPLDDTVSVTAVGEDFLRINQVGHQASLRTSNGETRWNRSFAAAATARLDDSLLVVATADGSEAVLDPATGADIIACEQCEVLVYPGGVLTMRTGADRQSVEVFARTGRDIGPEPVRTAASMAVVRGDSVLPVLTGVGANQVMEESGHYEVIDPATGAGLWQIADPELSKSHTRPCGTMVAFALKDRSRRFYELPDGAPLGRLDPPSVDDPGHNLDLLGCVGSSAAGTVVFAGSDMLTAYDAETGRIRWDREISGGVVDTVDGRLVLTQGSELIVLRPS